MVWETKRHEDEIRNLKYKIDSLSSEMSVYSTQRVEKETKIIELDHLIGQLLSVNETLVQQLSRNSINTTIPSKGSRQKSLKSTISTTGLIDNSKKKKKRSSSAPRVADIGTVSSDLKSSSILTSNLTSEKEKIKKNKERIHVNINDNHNENENGINRLHEMHNMYVTLAKTITGKNDLKTERSSSVRRRGTSEERDGSIKSNKKETSMKQRSKRNKDTGNIIGIAWSDRDRDDDTTLSRYSEKSNIPTYIESNNNHNNINNSHNNGNLDLQHVIQSLEEEFEGLSQEYNRLLNGNNNSNNIINGEDKSRELVSVIQRLHKKGEQLRALKSSPIKG